MTKKHRPSSAQITHADAPTIAPPPLEIPRLPSPEAAPSEVVITGGETHPVIHLIGLHHTIPSERFNHCAFTGKQIRFPEVAGRAGYRVVEYANGLGLFQDAVRDQKVDFVRIFGADHLDSAFADPNAVSTNFNDHDHRVYWETVVSRELVKRVKPGDIVAHVMPPAQRALIDKYPEQIHVETGIGYEADCAGTYRIFESETWRAWHQGRYGQGADWPHYRRHTLSAVVPNYYDVDDWAEGLKIATYGRSGDVLFVGRMTSAKGIEIVQFCAERFSDTAFTVISGEPRSDRLNAPNIHWAGKVDSRAELAGYYGRSLCVLVPSRYQEPFGGVCAEALLSGAPVIASDFGAFVEHVQEGDGLLAGSAEEFVMALGMLLDQPVESFADRQSRAERAAARWGYRAVAPMYKAAFASFRRSFAAGVRPA